MRLNIATADVVTQSAKKGRKKKGTPPSEEHLNEATLQAAAAQGKRTEFLLFRLNNSRKLGKLIQQLLRQLLCQFLMSLIRLVLEPDIDKALPEKPDP